MDHNLPKGFTARSVAWQRKKKKNLSNFKRSLTREFRLKVFFTNQFLLGRFEFRVNRRYQWHRRLAVHRGVNDTGDKLYRRWPYQRLIIAGVVDTNNYALPQIFVDFRHWRLIYRRQQWRQWLVHRRGVNYTGDKNCWRNISLVTKFINTLLILQLNSFYIKYGTHFLSQLFFIYRRGRWHWWLTMTFEYIRECS